MLKKNTLPTNTSKERSWGWENPKKRGIIERIKEKIDALSDDHEVKKRKNPLSSEPLDQSTEPKKSRTWWDIPPPEELAPKSPSKIADWFPNTVTFNPKKIQKWTFQETVGASVIAWILWLWTMGTILLIKMRMNQITQMEEEKKREELEKKEALMKKLESYGKKIQISETDQKTRIQEATGNTICLEKEILNYKDDLFPKVTYGSQWWSYFEILKLWPDNPGYTIDQKLAVTLQNIEIQNGGESMWAVVTKLPVLEIKRLAEKWMDERVLWQYQNELIGLAEEERGNRKNNMLYRDTLAKLILSIELIDNYIQKLESNYHERALLYTTRNISNFEWKKKRLEEIKKAIDNNAKVDQEYKEAKERWEKPKRGKKEYIPEEDRDFYYRFGDILYQVNTDSSLLAYRLIEEDKKTWGIISRALTEKIRRLRILKWIIEERVDQWKIDKYVIVELPKAVNYISPEEYDKEDDAEKKKNQQ